MLSILLGTGYGATAEKIGVCVVWAAIEYMGPASECGQKAELTANIHDMDHCKNRQCDIHTIRLQFVTIDSR